MIPIHSNETPINETIASKKCEKSDDSKPKENKDCYLKDDNRADEYRKKEIRKRFLDIDFENEGLDESYGDSDVFEP